MRRQRLRSPLRLARSFSLLPSLFFAESFCLSMEWSEWTDVIEFCDSFDELFRWRTTLVVPVHLMKNFNSATNSSRKEIYKVMHGVWFWCGRGLVLHSPSNPLHGVSHRIPSREYWQWRQLHRPASRGWRHHRRLPLPEQERHRLHWHSGEAGKSISKCFVFKIICRSLPNKHLRRVSPSTTWSSSQLAYLVPANARPPHSGRSYRANL